MRTLLFSVIFQLGLCLGLLGQDTLTRWFPIGAKWWYSYERRADSGWVMDLHVYEITGDTFIASDFDCKIMTKNFYVNGRGHAHSSRTVVCQKESKIYFYYGSSNGCSLTIGKLVLLYDFNAQPQDTVFILCNAPECAEYYVVDSVKSKHFNGRELKVQYNRGYESYPCATEWVLGDVIYEKLGSTLGFFGYTGFVSPEYLRCYEDNEVGLIRFNWSFMTSGEECFNVSRPSTSVASSVRLYPNPAGDKIQVEHPFGSLLALYDASGRCILRQKALGESTEWDVSHWPRGLYVLRVYDEQGREYAQKISLE